MDNYTILFNPYSGGCKGEEKAGKLKEILKGNKLTYCDITKIKDYGSFFENIDADEKIVLCGGDGTLNRFVNSEGTDNIKNELYFYATGSGNDFLRDIGMLGKDEIVDIKKYIEHLPTATVKGKTYKYINNVSFGLDGYCCEEADNQREQNKKNINYAAIALKGLAYDYHTRNATVIVDGVERHFEDVWMVPAMNGRYLGGGIKATPDQDRLNKDHKVSVLVVYKASRPRCLFSFPLIFSGKHAKLDICKIYEGNDVTVRFDEPTPVQIDGETIRNVTEYTVSSH